jgi:hypothetical protein
MERVRLFSLANNDDSVAISLSTITIISAYAYGLFTNSLMHFQFMLLCLSSVHSRNVMN